jgi:hypothetical protein
LFMSFNLSVGLTTTFISIMLIASLGVTALNSVVVGGLVVAIVKDVFHDLNQSQVFAVIYLSFLLLIFITGYLFIFLGFENQELFPAMSVMILSWLGSISFTIWLYLRTNTEQLHVHTTAGTLLIGQYAGIYAETEGVNKLKFEVIHGSLCVGILEAGHLLKTTALDHNKFGLTEDDDYIFTFFESGDHDLIASDGEIVHFYQRTGS